MTNEEKEKLTTNKPEENKTNRSCGTYQRQLQWRNMLVNFYILLTVHHVMILGK